MQAFKNAKMALLEKNADISRFQPLWYFEKTPKKTQFIFVCIFKTLAMKAF
jgi:hypothetical protein